MNPDYVQYSANPPIGSGAESGLIALIFGFMAFFALFFLIYYIWYAICLMKIANKTNTPNSWFAWIPILNVILMIQIAKKPIWWIILYFIPIVNFIIGIIVWMGIAESVKKPNWLGILMIFPIVDLITIGIMAFSSSETTN